MAVAGEIGTEGIVARRVGIVVSTYNANITTRLEEGAIKTLMEGGFAPHELIVTKVPGAWELPLAAKRLLRDEAIRGVVCLGAVIRGETTHDQHINRAVSTALMQLMLEHGRPVGFGLLTCNNLEQALHRAGGNVGNKGSETAQAVLQMLAD
ncbi:MAG: 6,7-dimethyl-8-ribityllumazine synthase [Planctomycetales bacterium]|nr:6,7-dimethyl-8-ribityllumazine synthase [Planctomycetales bacterium]